ncbi:hypothetical protein M1B72_12565 [Geomonas paludis]|uniref:Uncharacterized protein n=1 Tax=Geomonas paludis TaxID=2740185 RepID=A0A6V8MWQ6_9BACT|nr:hypothetical protein [Geomonas paludis]UPU34282.1 hypothetical protein M1B72_12565 [Geomonas paludis]GFO64264.1 hypothetical protein GMPD_21830 [Geomonas paludis]
MKPYHQIFPDAAGATMTLELLAQSGRIPKGSYAFVECYCTSPGCDCRRVALLVLDQKQRQKAMICLGFDGDGPFTGPYLDGSSYQITYAEELLDFCVHTLNARPEWVARMQQRYGEVRELIDGVPYRGAPFPLPGDLFYRAMPAPDLETMLTESVRHGFTPGCPQPTCAAPGGPSGIMRLMELFARAGVSASISILLSLQDELHRHLLADPLAVEELATLLAALGRDEKADHDRVSAALRILSLTLEFYQVEAEGGRPGARQQLQRLQSALVLRVYRERSSMELRLLVTDILLNSRLNLIPELQAICRAGEGDAQGPLYVQAASSEEFVSGVLRHFASTGVTCPFAGAQEILELFSVNDPELRPGLTWELLTADAPFLREIAALLVFNPEPELSREVARMLVAVAGATLTPSTLRRLIMARNWFAEPTRGIVDQTINNARRARVPCAHLEAPGEETVYASCLDGSGGQFFHVIVADQAAYAGCILTLQEGGGLADCTVVRLETRRDREDFVRAARSRRCCLASTGEYLDLRLGMALTAGTEAGRAPGHWLVRTAELLGRDHWKGSVLDPVDTLQQLAEEVEGDRHLRSQSPAGGEEGKGDRHLRSQSPASEEMLALEESGQWHRYRALFGNWRVEGSAVDRVIEAARGAGKTVKAAIVLERLCDQVLEQQRPLLLERLVLQTLWLKAAAGEAPIPWQRMYHVAQAVADEGIALKEIPLAVSIARHSFTAYRKRNENNRQGSGS